MKESAQRNIQWIKLKRKNVDFQKYENELENRFPAAFESFKATRIPKGHFLTEVLVFINSFGIEIKCYKSTSLKHKETFTTTFFFKNLKIGKVLGKKIEKMSIPYHSSH